jgi:abnormal spindle-like microcephaly-associated protein
VKVRQACKSKAVRAIRRQVMEANRKATVNQQLGNRMKRAVDSLFKYKQLAYVLEAVMDLGAFYCISPTKFVKCWIYFSDVTTRLSDVCCLELVEHCAVPVIFRLIRSCNRSVPHMEIVKYSINVLLNLGKYEETREAVFSEEGSISCLIELLQVYREKSIIFNKTCTLLGVLCYNVKCRKVRKLTNEFLFWFTGPFPSGGDRKQEVC